MGDLISMAEWKRGRNPGSQTTAEQDELVQHISTLLLDADSLMQGMPGLSTVYKRERAVIDAQKLVEQAHEIAASVGWKIIRLEGNGVKEYKIVFKE